MQYLRFIIQHLPVPSVQNKDAVAKEPNTSEPGTAALLNGYSARRFRGFDKQLSVNLSITYRYLRNMGGTRLVFKQFIHQNRGVKFITLFITISLNNLTWNALFNRNKYLKPIYLIKGDLTTACHQIIHCQLSFPVEWINIMSHCWSRVNHHLSLDNALSMWEW